MHILFVALLGALTFIGILLLIGLFSKKDYSVFREIVINKPSSEVYNYLSHIKNQDHFSKWVMTDPSMKKTFTGEDANVGFIYAWDSENKQAGKGEQEIIELVPNKKINVEVRFEKPFKGIAQTPFEVVSLSPNETKVIWGMSSKMNYPMNIMLLFVNFEKILGKDLEISLKNLKTNLEKN